MAWRIRFERSAERDLDKLGKPASDRILKFLFGRVAILEDARSIGEALNGPRFGQFWKYRVGDYRIVARIDDQAVTVLVFQVGHRRDIYR